MSGRAELAALPPRFTSPARLWFRYITGQPESPTDSTEARLATDRVPAAGPGLRLRDAQSSRQRARVLWSRRLESGHGSDGPRRTHRLGGRAGHADHGRTVSRARDGESVSRAHGAGGARLGSRRPAGVAAARKRAQRPDASGRHHLVDHRSVCPSGRRAPVSAGGPPARRAARAPAARGPRAGRAGRGETDAGRCTSRRADALAGWTAGIFRERRLPHAPYSRSGVRGSGARRWAP